MKRKISIVSKFAGSPEYKMTIRVYDLSSLKAKQTIEFSKTVSSWITIGGRLAGDAFTRDLDTLVKKIATV